MLAVLSPVVTGLHLSHRPQELSGVFLLMAGPHRLALAGPQNGDLLAGGVGGGLAAYGSSQRSGRRGCTLQVSWLIQFVESIHVFQDGPGMNATTLVEPADVGSSALFCAIAAGVVPDQTVPGAVGLFQDQG